MLCEVEFITDNILQIFFNEFDVDQLQHLFNYSQWIV